MHETRTAAKNGKRNWPRIVALSRLGAFDTRDGKIATRRDYFDAATWQKRNAK